MLKVPIGGFYELELPKTNNSFHKNAIELSTGRACLSLIIEIEQPKKVFIPFYACSALYEPLNQHNIEFEFYAINKNLEPILLPSLKENELFIYVNYFGLKNKFCDKLINLYKSKVIIDNTHNFFHKGYKNIYSFTSARKYFGVPDGAYLYSPKNIKYKQYPRNITVNLEHNILRLEEKYDLSYKKYLNNENLFNCNILRISKISQKILKTIDYTKIKKRRVQNYNFINDKLNNYNLLKILNDENSIPYCYPLLLDRKIEKNNFHINNIFIPTLWPDILLRENKDYSFEKDFTQKLVPIPIDHRYNLNDMKNMLKIVKRIINE